MKTYHQSVAILIDGAFFLHRYQSLVSKTDTPCEVANTIVRFAQRHVGAGVYHYRTFFYDCLPFNKRIHHPLTNRVIDFARTDAFKFRMGLFEELKKKRKMALRLGELKDAKTWSFRPGLTRDILAGRKIVASFEEQDLVYDLRQKGIDIKIGMDIALLSLKKLVTQIVLVSGDADFVPASKLARREGIDFILDPMWSNIDAGLFEHIDGLRSAFPKPGHRSASRSPGHI